MKTTEFKKLIREEIRKVVEMVSSTTTKFGIKWDEEEDKPETVFFGRLIGFLQAKGYIKDVDWSKLKGKEEECIELIKNKIIGK